jgi:predicted kinase
MNSVPTSGRSPTLMLFCGMPGSGKTTLAKRLERDSRGIRLCTDDWQAALGIEHTNEEFHELLQERLCELCGELLDHGQNVILEDGLWFRVEREQKRRMAKEHGARTEMHYFDLSLDQVWHRIQARNLLGDPHSVPIAREVIKRIAALFERPDRSEIALYDACVVHNFDDQP